MAVRRWQNSDTLPTAAYLTTYYLPLTTGYWSMLRSKKLFLIRHAQSYPRASQPDCLLEFKGGELQWISSFEPPDGLLEISTSHEETPIEYSDRLLA